MFQSSRRRTSYPLGINNRALVQDFLIVKVKTLCVKKRWINCGSTKGVGFFVENVLGNSPAYPGEGDHCKMFCKRYTAGLLVPHFSIDPVQGLL